MTHYLDYFIQPDTIENEIPKCALKQTHKTRKQIGITYFDFSKLFHSKKHMPLS